MSKITAISDDNYPIKISAQQASLIKDAIEEKQENKAYVSEEVWVIADLLKKLDDIIYEELMRQVNKGNLQGL